MENTEVPGIIIGKLMHINGMLQRSGNRLLQPFGLNYQQFSIFFEIGRAGKVRQKEVVNRLLLDKSHVSKVVKKLSGIGLIRVEETSEDRRSYWLSLTPEGEDTLKQCRQMFSNWHAQWAGSLDEAGLSSMLAHLEQLQTLFKKAI